MKHLKLFFALFAMLALGVGNAWADTFTRISSASDLADGDEIIFVDQAGEYACGTTQQTNNRTLVAIETNDYSYSYQSSDNVQVFVVKKNGTNYGFHTGTGYIYSASSSKNYLKTNTTASTTSPTETSAWTLSVSGNVFTVQNVTNTSYYLALNMSNSPKLFSQYKTGQSKPCIYKKQSSSPPPTIASLVQIEKTAGKTEFVEGEAFEKATITATYDDESTKDVTSLATFTGYDMNTTGTQTVTVTYEDQTTTYQITVNAKTPATLTLSKNGDTSDKIEGKVGDVITLPDFTSDCSKTFVGWDADENCNHAPTYAPGAEYTLAAETQILYAVYADGESGEVVTQTLTITDQTTNSTYRNNSFTDNKGGVWSGQSNIPDATHFGLRQNDDNTHMASPVFPNNIINITAKIRNQSKSERKVYLCSNNTTAKPSSGDLGGVNVNGSVTDIEHTFTLNGTFNQFYIYTNGALQFNEIEVTYSSAPTYSNYSTTCAAAPIVTVTPETVTANATGAEGKVTVTYENVNTANVTVALYNDEACTATFTAGWLTASIDADKNIAYTVAENTTYAERKAYIQLTAPETTGAVDPAVIVIPVTQAGKDKVFASLEALLAAITPTTEGVEVTVTLTNEVIQDFYTSGSYRNGVKLNVPYQGNTKAIEIYCKDVPAEWVKGGKLSGTITCPWKLYNSTWELCPTAWTELTYTAPATVKSIAVSGTPTKTTYVDGEAFDPTGLVVTATLTDDSTEPIDVALVDWTFDPETLSKGETSVSVVATYNTMASAAYEVTGLTVNDIPTKTVAEFITAGGTRCYLEGIVSGLTEGNSMKYGNFDLTDASGTIYVYGCLNAAGESQKFADLGVKNGDKIKVIADEYKLYEGTKQEAINVQYVSHISAATITIADITMEVGETHTILASVEPVADVTYTIKENTDNAISLDGNTITALAEGTATITATVEEGATYLGNSVDFTVTVGPKTESDEVVILAEHNGQWYALKAEDLNSDNKVLAALAVTYFNGTLYNVNESDKISITWTRTVVGDQVTFKNGTNYLYVANPSKTDLSLNATAFSWTYDAVLDTYTSNNGARTFLYSSEANGFKNFAINNNVGTKNYSGYPVVTAPVYATGLIIGEGENTLTDGEVIDVTVNRSFTAGSLYTISLPFALDAFQVETIFGAGTTLYQFAQLVKENEELVLYFSTPSAIAAATPYLIQPKQDVAAGFTVEDATISTTPNNISFTVDATTVTMKPILSATAGEKTNGVTEFWLAADTWLYNDVNTVLSLRALFNISTVSGMPPRCRVALGENAETGVDNIITTDAPVKVIENGQLIIIRDGEKYNVQGQKL